MSNRVMHFEIQANDVGRAKDFYEKVFGWEITQAMSKEDGGMDYWSVKTGESGEPGINGGLYARPEGPEERIIYTYDCTVVVDDLDRAMEAVEKNGGTIRQGKMEIPKVGWFASALDTEGNVFGIMQPGD